MIIVFLDHTIAAQSACACDKKKKCQKFQGYIILLFQNYDFHIILCNIHCAMRIETCAVRIVICAVRKNFTTRILTRTARARRAHAATFRRARGLYSSFLLAFILRVEESVRFCSFYEAKHLFFKKRSKSTRQTHFFKMSQNSFI